MQRGEGKAGDSREGQPSNQRFVLGQKVEGDGRGEKPLAGL